MVHTFIVTVETDDNNLDAPDARTISNEIESTLEYLSLGIVSVDVKTPASNYRESVIRSHEQ